MTRFRTGGSKRSQIDPLIWKPFLGILFIPELSDFSGWYSFMPNFLKESQQFQEHN